MGNPWGAACAVMPAGGEGARGRGREGKRKGRKMDKVCRGSKRRGEIDGDGGFRIWGGGTPLWGRRRRRGAEAEHMSKLELAAQIRAQRFNGPDSMSLTVRSACFFKIPSLPPRLSFAYSTPSYLCCYSTIHDLLSLLRHILRQCPPPLSRSPSTSPTSPGRRGGQQSRTLR